MIRLGISTEGATEREFVDKVLRPHLNLFDVEATAIDMRGIVTWSILSSNDGSYPTSNNTNSKPYFLQCQSKPLNGCRHKTRH